MKIAVESRLHIVFLVLVGTLIALAATNLLTYGVIGVQVTPRVLLATVICPVVIAPVILSVLGHAMLKATQLRRRLQYALERDHLTDIYNREYFFERLQACPSDTRAAILMVDVDHFKAVNDTYGHFVGDDVIRAVAQILAGTVRKSDFVARFGGEEFVAFLHDENLTGALAVAERFRKAVEVNRLETALGIIQVTVSVGLGLTCHAENAVQAVDEADHALLSAKEAGRNRVMVAKSLVGGRATEAALPA